METSLSDSFEEKTFATENLKKMCEHFFTEQKFNNAKFPEQSVLQLNIEQRNIQIKRNFVSNTNIFYYNL